MKLTYLGTAAAEGFPALFCRCAHCAEARRLGGKNVRTRSQSLVNDDLLIDLPADTYMHLLQHGMEADRIRYLLITHAHQDHCYPGELKLRHPPYAHNMRADVLHVFCPRTVYEAFDTIPENVELSVLTAFHPVEIGAYTVTPLPARHMFGTEAFIYLIEGERALLYAHDTGYFYDEVFAYLKERGVVLDMISLDCTNVDIPISDEDSHMGFANIGRVLDRLRADGVVRPHTKVLVNHFSHNGAPLHHLLEARANPLGYGVSYDGCTVEF